MPSRPSSASAGRLTPLTRPATDNGTGSPITLSASASRRDTAGNSGQAGQDGGLEAAGHRQVPLAGEQPGLGYFSQQGLDIQRSAAGMPVQPFSGVGRQRHSRLTAHLQNVFGVQTPQDQAATARVVTAKPVPAVVAPRLRPRGHQHHHRVPIQPLRRRKQGQARLPIRPVQVFHHDHCRLGTFRMPESVEQRQAGRERSISPVHAGLAGHEERSVRGVLLARHAQD